MNHLKTIFYVLVFLSILSLGSGFIWVGQWPWAILVVGLGLIWVYPIKSSLDWRPPVCLIMATALSAAGVMSGASFGLMMIGSISALAAWDILLLNENEINPNNLQNTRYIADHLKLLFFVLGLAALIIGLGQFGSVQLPFILMIFLIALILFCLEQVWRLIKQHDG